MDKLKTLWVKDSKNGGSNPKEIFKPSSSLRNTRNNWDITVPTKFIQHFSKEGEYIWSPFAGDGIDKVVADFFGRDIILSDKDSVDAGIIYNTDARYFNPSGHTRNNMEIGLVLADVPSLNSNNKLTNLRHYLRWLTEVIENTSKYLKEGGVYVLCLSNCVYKGQELNLAQAFAMIAENHNLTLKTQIVKEKSNEGKIGDARSLNLCTINNIRRSDVYGENIYVFVKEKPRVNFGRILKNFI